MSSLTSCCVAPTTRVSVALSSLILSSFRGRPLFLTGLTLSFGVVLLDAEATFLGHVEFFKLFPAHCPQKFLYSGVGSRAPLLLCRFTTMPLLLRLASFFVSFCCFDSCDALGVIEFSLSEDVRVCREGSRGSMNAERVFCLGSWEALVCHAGGIEILGKSSKDVRMVAR